MMALRIIPVLAATLAILVSGCTDPAADDDAATDHPMDPGHQHTPGMTHSNQTTSGPMPSEPGQGAFAAIQEIVLLLESDPATDWSRVNLTALRDHLVDMDLVTLHSQVETVDVPDGIRVTATGGPDIAAALARMVPAHTQVINALNGWNVTWSALPDGIQLTATSQDPHEAQHIQALGFFGLLATGAHQPRAPQDARAGIPNALESDALFA